MMTFIYYIMTPWNTMEFHYKAVLKEYLHIFKQTFIIVNSTFVLFLSGQVDTKVKAIFSVTFMTVKSHFNKTF